MTRAFDLERSAAKLNEEQTVATIQELKRSVHALSPRKGKSKALPVAVALSSSSLASTATSPKHASSGGGGGGGGGDERFETRRSSLGNSIAYVL